MFTAGLWLMLVIPLFSQEGRIQEIQSLYEQSKKFGNYPDSLWQYGEKILSLSEENNSFGQLTGYYLKGYSEYKKGDFKKSVPLFDTALTHYKKTINDHYPETIKVFISRATAYGRMGKNDSADVAFERVITLAKEHQDFDAQATAYNGLGIGEKNKGNYQKAIEYYQKAFENWEKAGNKGKLTFVLMNIGIAQSGIGNHEQAHQSFMEGLKIAQETGHKENEYRMYNNISVNLSVMKKTDSARYYLHKVVPFYKERNMKMPLFLAYQNLGKSFVEEAKMDSVFYYIEKAEKGFTSLNYENGLMELDYLAAEAYLTNNQYQKALDHLEEAETWARSQKMDNYLANIYNFKAEAYEGLGRYDKATESLKLEDSLKQLKYTNDNSKSLNELLTKHQVNRKNEEINNLSQENSFYKSTAFIVGIIALVVVSLLLFYGKRFRSSQKELKDLRKRFETYHHKAQENTSNLYALKSKAVVKIEKLMYVKSDGHYVEFYTEGEPKPEIDRNALKEVLLQLEGEGFVQIHKSYLVNLQYIRIINSTKIMLQDGTWLPLSRTYKPRLKETLITRTPE
tara:strand:- start:4725 stop:6428 length:1704 start_codon:yes stop_codon:yes gene_type:complete